MVFFRSHQTGHLPDRHVRVPLQHFRQVTFMFRVQVGDDHIRHARIVWQSLKECL